MQRMYRSLPNVSTRLAFYQNLLSNKKGMRYLCTYSEHEIRLDTIDKMTLIFYDHSSDSQKEYRRIYSI